MKYTLDEENDSVCMDDGTTLTIDDFQDSYLVCFDCGEAFPKDEMILCNDEYYCPSCVRHNHIRRCSGCGDYCFGSDCVTTSDTSRYFCSSCTDDLYRCADCGDYYEHSDNMIYDDETQDYYCENCYDERDHGIIQRYHDFKENGVLRFYGDEKREDSVHLGFELEIDGGRSPDECASALDYRFDGFFHYEHDGSLDDNGFELISQPASIEYLVGMEDEFREAFNIGTSQYGYSSHNAGTCGLHVHIDSDYFGSALDTAQAKMLFLFERHWDNLIRFSRRTPNQMRWCARYGTDIKLTDIMKAKKNRSLDRYYAVNLSSSNYHNFEIRLWRGTLNINTFMATLKFTARLAKLVKETPAVTLAKMTFDEILGDDPQIRSYWESRQ